MRKVEINENRWIQYAYFNMGGVAYAIVATVNDYRDDKKKPVDPAGSFQGDWAVYCGSTVSTEHTLPNAMKNGSEQETADYAIRYGFKFPYEWAKGIFPDIAETGLHYRD